MLSFVMIPLWRVLLFPVNALVYTPNEQHSKCLCTVEAVERAAGLSLFSNEVKAGSKHICKTTKCEVTIRRFDDAQKKGRKAITAPK